MSKRVFLLIFFVVVVGLVGSAAAEDKTWLGTDTNWFNPDNWDPVGVPVRGWTGGPGAPGDIVHINGGVANYPIISTTDPCATCKKLWLGTVDYSGDAYLTIEDGGELTIRSYETGTGNQTLVLGQKTGTHGFLTMNGGTINDGWRTVRNRRSGQRCKWHFRYERRTLHWRRSQIVRLRQHRYRKTQRTRRCL